MLADLLAFVFDELFQTIDNRQEALRVDAGKVTCKNDSKRNPARSPDTRIDETAHTISAVKLGNLVVCDDIESL